MFGIWINTKYLQTVKVQVEITIHSENQQCEAQKLTPLLKSLLMDTINQHFCKKNVWHFFGHIGVKASGSDTYLAFNIFQGFPCFYGRHTKSVAHWLEIGRFYLPF